MSIYALREAFYNASQEQENEALTNLVNAYHKARKEALKPIYRVDLIKHTKAVYVEPDNTMRLNWNEWNIMDMFLPGLAAVLILILVEMIEDRKRKEFIIKKQACEITRLYNENHALENKAQQMITEYENECW